MGVKAEELGPGEAAAVLKENLSDLGPVARRVLGGYFDIPLDAPLANWEREAPRHPPSSFASTLPSADPIWATAPTRNQTQPRSLDEILIPSSPDVLSRRRLSPRCREERSRVDWVSPSRSVAQKGNRRPDVGREIACLGNHPTRITPEWTTVLEVSRQERIGNSPRYQSPDRPDPVQRERITAFRPGTVLWPNTGRALVRLRTAEGPFPLGTFSPAYPTGGGAPSQMR